MKAFFKTSIKKKLQPPGVENTLKEEETYFMKHKSDREAKRSEGERFFLYFWGFHKACAQRNQTKKLCTHKHTLTEKNNSFDKRCHRKRSTRRPADDRAAREEHRKSSKSL